MASDLELTERIRLLNPEQLAELRLFVDFLLNKTQISANKNGGHSPVKVLDDLKRIPVPVDNVIIDRAILYDDRI